MTTHWPGWGKAPKENQKLDETHPDIEWMIEEQSRFDTENGSKRTKYHWEVSNTKTNKTLVGTTREGWGIKPAREAVTRAANYLLTHDLTWSKTLPCVICDKPSRVGNATCSHAHDLILEKVKKELADVPL